MDPKRPAAPLMAAPRGSSALRASSTSARATLEDEHEPTPARATGNRPDLTLVKPTASHNSFEKPSLATPLTDTVLELPTMTPGADAETVMVLERLRSLSPALEFPFGAQRFDADAFFALPETPDDSRCYELIDGVVVVSPSVLPEHSLFTLNLLVALFQVTRERGLGPIFSEVDLSPNPQNVYRPDLMWFGALPTDDETLSRRLIGVIPWVVLETLSEKTKRYDQIEKRSKYEQMGVKEYWILHPKKKWLEVHHFAQKRVTRLKQVDERLTTDLLPGWSLSMGSLFDPQFDPYAEKSAKLLEEYEDKRQALKDAFEDAEERRAQAEGAALREREQREQAEVRAMSAEERLNQAAKTLNHTEERLSDTEERLSDIRERLTHAEARAEAERRLRVQESERFAQVEQARLTALTQQAQAQAAAEEAQKLAASLQARLAALEQELRSKS